MRIRFWRKPKLPMQCPVCNSCTWNVYEVSFIKHKRSFLKSKIYSMQGPWGTCTRCKNHFSFWRGPEPVLLDREGGIPVEEAALKKARGIFTTGDPNLYRT